MERISIENRMKLFKDITKLITAMENYEYDQSEKNKTKLDFLAIVSEDILLPSGKWGNILSLALEMHYFITANYLLEKKDEFFISLDYVAFELEKVGTAIHFEDELDFVLSYYNAEENEMLKYCNTIISENNVTKNIYKENKKAIENLLGFKRNKR